jgi:hypothetical protein
MRFAIFSIGLIVALQTFDKSALAADAELTVIDGLCTKSRVHAQLIATATSR